MKRFILAAILALGITSAQASNNNDGGNATATASHNGNTTATGGNASATGGAGGAGGNAVANGGAGGSATIIDNTRNTNTNTNINSNKNEQSQGQGQAQGQKQGQGQGQGQSQSTRNSNNAKQDVKVEGDTHNYKRSAPGVSIAGMNATAMCMSGVSAGGSAPIGGLAFGFHVRDEICSFLDTGKTMVVVGLETGVDSMVERGIAMINRAGDLLEQKYGKTADAKVQATSRPTGTAAVIDAPLNP